MSTYPGADSVHYLLQDVLALPVLFRRSQELWLGIQLKAPERVSRLCGSTRDAPGTADPSVSPRAAYEGLLAVYSRLSEACERAGVDDPAIEIWAAELLGVRRDVFAFQPLRLRRFLRTVDTLAHGAIKGSLLDLAYSVAETLCLLPDAALQSIIDFVRVHERLLTSDEMAELLGPAAEADDLRTAAERRARAARDALVTGYARYALRVARGFVDRGLDYADLAQESFVGLMKAAEQFDYRVQARFGTYATTWVWQSVGRALADQGRLVRLPVHVQEAVQRLEDAYERLADVYGNDPSPEALLLESGLLREGVAEGVKRCAAAGVPLPDPIARRLERGVNRVTRLLAQAQPAISLQAEVPPDVVPVELRPLGTDSARGCPLSDLLCDTDQPTPEEITDRRALQGALQELLRSLSERECHVIELRFGLGDGTARTLEEIGRMFGVTRERVRQIEAKAFRKLRQPSRMAKLKPWAGYAYRIVPRLPRVAGDVLARLDTDRVHLRDHRATHRMGAWRWLDRLLDKLPSGWSREGSLRGMTHQERLVGILRALAAPAHYSDLAEQLSSSLEGEDLNEGYVYSVLTKHAEMFILLGEGVFSLVESERERGRQEAPVLPFCPVPLPDPPGERDTFFESVLVARERFQHCARASELVRGMLEWAGLGSAQPKWFAQSLLSAYYLVGLIPYLFCYDGSDPELTCALPSVGIQELRRYCLPWQCHICQGGHNRVVEKVCLNLQSIE